MGETRPNFETELPSLGFGEQNVGRVHFWVDGTLLGWSTLGLRL